MVKQQKRQPSTFKNLKNEFSGESDYDEESKSAHDTKSHNSWQPEFRVDFARFAEVQRMSSADVALNAAAKKRSYLVLKPTRDLYLFKNGDFAYFQHGAAGVVFKAFFKPAQMLRVSVEDEHL